MFETDKKTKKRLKVVVVGGGFGGIKTVLELIEEPTIDVTLISDNRDFRYHPTLYHVATGGYHVQTIIPLTDIFEAKPVNLIYGEAKSINRKAKKITLASSQHVPYDKLVLALGSVTNYFGIKGLKRYSYGIKTYEEAVELKAHLHKRLISQHQPDLNYVIVGGGPTGVELAGALPAYIRQLMRKHGIKHRAVHIELVEAAPRILPNMPKDLSRSVARHLRHLGIKIYMGAKVEGETANDLIVSGRSIASKTVIWTAGVHNHPFFESNEFSESKNGRVSVDAYLTAEPDIYVIGDNADTQYSGMAQTAIHDAVFVAENIIRQKNDKKAKTYQPKRPVYVTPAGPHWAAMLWGQIRIYGRLGWLMRRAADFLAYHDVEPWWKASRQWWAENTEEETCEYCAAADPSN